MASFEEEKNTGLAHSLSKSETLALFFNKADTHGELEKHLSSEDRVFFHSDEQLDGSFKQVSVIAAVLLGITLLNDIFFIIFALFDSSRSEGHWEIVIVLTSLLVLFSFAAFSLLFFLPFRNSVFLTRRSLIVVHKRLFIKAYSVVDDLSKMESLSFSTVVDIPQRSFFSPEELEVVAKENASVRVDGTLEVKSEATQKVTHHFANVENANDLIEVVSQLFDISPTYTISLQRNFFLTMTAIASGVYSVVLACVGFFFVYELGLASVVLLVPFVLVLFILTVSGVGFSFSRKNLHDLTHHFEIPSHRL